MSKKLDYNKACSMNATMSDRRHTILFVAVAFLICMMLGTCAAGALDARADDESLCPHLSWDTVEIEGEYSPSSAASVSDSSSLLNISLVNNVTLLEDWRINGEVQICLNGYMLNLNGHHVVVEDGGNLSLYDCGDRVWQFNNNSNGLWTVALDIESDTTSGVAGLEDAKAEDADAEDAASTGDEISDDAIATDETVVTDDTIIISIYTVSGGIITNGSATNGGGVEVEANGNFTMFSGNIVGNNATENGGGVFVADGATFTNLGGNVLGNAAENVLGADVYNAAESIAPLSMGLMATSFDSNFSAVTHTGHSGGAWQEWNHTNTTGPTIAGYYVLTENINLTDRWIVPAGETHLCLNGFVMNQTNFNILVDNGSKLILEDCKFENESHIHYFEHDNVTEPWTWNDSNTSSPFTVKGGAITGGIFTGNGGGIRILQEGNLTMFGGNIVGNSAQGTSDSTIHGFGGGVFVRGVFILHNGNIVGNAADTEGGGVLVGSALGKMGRFIMYNGNITDNYAPNSGGGIASHNSTEFVMYGGKISNNLAELYDGGGVYVEKSTFKMRGGLITDNFARYGGGIAAHYGGIFDITSGTITKNSASHFGSGVSLVGYEEEGRESYGNMTIGGSGYINITENRNSESGLRDNLYLPEGWSIIMEDGAELQPGSMIHMRHSSDNLDTGIAAYSNIENNKNFFGRDVPANIDWLYNAVTHAIYYEQNDNPDSRFSPVPHEHPTRPGFIWHEWNDTHNIPPTSASHYVLTTDVTFDGMTGDCEIPVGTTIICLNGHKLELNGHKITVTGEDRLLAISDCCQSTIHYFEPQPNGEWEEVAGPTMYNVTGGYITNSEHEGGDGGALYIGGGEVHMTGGNIVGCSANSGGAVYIHGGLLRLTGGSIAGNVATTGGGGGVEIANTGLLRIISGNITGNSAVNGGGVDVYGGGAFELGEGTVSKNTATGEGGGVRSTGPGRFEMYPGSLVTENSAYNGGGVFLNGGTSVRSAFTQWGGTLSNNFATNEGGGVNLYNQGKFNMYGGNIIGNSVGPTGNGVGIHVTDKYCDLEMADNATVGTLDPATNMDDIHFDGTEHDPIVIVNNSFSGSATNLTTKDNNGFKNNNPVIQIQAGTNVHSYQVYSKFILNHVKDNGRLVILDDKTIRYENGGGGAYVTINVVNPQYGTANPNGIYYYGKSAYKKINITPNPECWIDSLVDNGVTIPLSQSQKETGLTYTFNAGAGQTVTITFGGNEPEPPEVILYHVTNSSSIVNGTVAANKSTELNPSEVVQLTARPETGHLLGNLTVSPEDGGENITIIEASSSPSETIYNFAMPEANVTVNAIFGLVGDANNDHEISIIDSACVGIHIIRDGSEDPLITDPVSSKCADVDGDGFVNVLDLYMINGYLVGLYDSFPAAAP